MVIKKILSRLKMCGLIVQSIPSRVLFGNVLSLSHNISPYLENLKIKKPKKKSNEISKIGFKKITYNLDKEIIENIHRKYNNLITNKNSLSVTENNKKRFLLDPLKYIPEIKDLVRVFEKDILNYYGTNFKITQIRAFRNFSDDSADWDRPKYLYSNLWHFDNFKTNKLKIFVLLNDNISKETGCTRIINKKNSIKLIRNFKFLHTSLVNKKFEEYLLKNNLIEYCSGNLGDIYIMNTQQCLHAASIPKKGVYRDVIVFEIFQNTDNEKNIFDLEEDNFVHGLRKNLINLN